MKEKNRLQARKGTEYVFVLFPGLGWVNKGMVNLGEREAYANHCFSSFLDHSGRPVKEVAFMKFCLPGNSFVPDELVRSQATMMRVSGLLPVGHIFYMGPIQCEILDVAPAQRGFARHYRYSYRTDAGELLQAFMPIQFVRDFAGNGRVA
jgi:hypothetical protein